FPLRRPRSRAQSHHHGVTAEEPLFVNPEEDPSRHIRFRQEYAYAFRRSQRGQLTIDALGLNRTELVERRRDRLAIVTMLMELRALLIKKIDEAKAAGAVVPPDFPPQLTKLNDLLAEMSRDTAEYAAMVRAAVA